MSPELHDKLTRNLRAFEVAAIQAGRNWYSHTERSYWERKMEQARRDLHDVVEDAVADAVKSERIAS